MAAALTKPANIAYRPKRITPPREPPSLDEHLRRGHRRHLRGSRSPVACRDRSTRLPRRLDSNSTSAPLSQPASQVNSTPSAMTLAFRALHSSRNAPLLLADAGDVTSARLVEGAGAHAIPTKSAGVAWALGRSDGSTLTRTGRRHRTHFRTGCTVLALLSVPAECS
ncbi:isocitrate lyase/phosphoenolpyruvate mutase family protein [Curtobacterium sp. 22159]|uniref:isocitrate lyase/phosphoenolpyruvate mutase family protein n=1 Tax=Curtobacterium sp. 22159 TaxID=3453882 RepID=UPI003F874247